MSSRKQFTIIAKVHPNVVTTNTPVPSSRGGSSPAAAAAAAASATSPVVKKMAAATTTAAGAGGAGGGTSTSPVAHHPFVRRYEDELIQRRSEYDGSGGDPERLPPVAETLNALALVHHHMARDPATALMYHGEALAVLEECIARSCRGCCAGGDCACVSEGGGRSISQSSAQNERSCRRCGGEEEESEQQQRRLVALRFHAAVTLSDLGDARYTLGRYAEAHSSYDEALDRYREAGVGDGHPRVVSTRNRMERLRLRGEEIDDYANAPSGVQNSKSRAEGPGRLQQAAFVAKGA